VRRPFKYAIALTILGLGSFFCAIFTTFAVEEGAQLSGGTPNSYLPIGLYFFAIMFLGIGLVLELRLFLSIRSWRRAGFSMAILLQAIVLVLAVWLLHVGAWAQ
jgi:hypothetical protein